MNVLESIFGVDGSDVDGDEHCGDNENGEHEVLNDYSEVPMTPTLLTFSRALLSEGL